MMARTPTTTPRKPRATPMGPRTTNVLLRCVNGDGVSVSLPPNVKIELVTVSGDKAKLFDAVMADRNLIALEHHYPVLPTDNPVPAILREAAE